MAVLKKCPGCQGDISADAPEGLCPECLFRQALSTPKDEPNQEERGRAPAPNFKPPSPAELAKYFPQLEILELVGQGGMGAVYKARQPKLDRLVAVKILPPEAGSDAAFAERFMREARSLARLNHPNIVTIYDFGEIDGLYYFSMEFVDGKNVRELIDAGNLPAASAIKIVPQICEALQYAHDEGIVHRDIKPENILIDKRGRVKIADFGLAKIVGLTPTYLTLTGSHEVMGTLYYMAPEQLKRSKQVDHRADLYSLGVVFYEMLTGELPVGRFAPPSHKARVDGRLDPVVLRALSREPENRYQDASEIKRAVETLAAQPHSPHVAAPAPRPEPVYSPANWPVVRFSIPHTNWIGGKAKGEIYRDQENLIIEFKQGWLTWQPALKVLRIPIREIVAISCQTESWPKLEGVDKLVKAWRPLVMVIKAPGSKALDELPVGSIDKGRLLINKRDTDAARALVQSIVRPILPKEGPVSDVAKPLQDAESFRKAVLPAGVNLLAAGIMVMAVSLAWAIPTAVKMLSGTIDASIGHLFGLATSLLGACLAGFVIVGAGHMLRGRSHVLAVTAAILAMAPTSFVWLYAFPIGIWSLAVLRKPEVRAAFRRSRESPVGDGPEPPKVHRVVADQFVGLFRSAVGYMLPTSAGQRKAGMAPSAPTVDYNPEQAAAPEPRN
jgi:serine/threonine protein kinase